ncbi:putative trna methyltransferase [Phaeomoniella chlamydospora]|uniref:Putative trna methyltransferase n=1 Tax=Phaeomoniella chlamydospora TaxID=158046 RepID=A0A0G2GGH6_PHACM|nr:putative trna methyltransferase [Phaeomoniella chlamydospora]
MVLYLDNGSILSSWPQTSESAANDSLVTKNGNDENNEPPAKRQKRDPDAAGQLPETRVELDTEKLQREKGQQKPRKGTQGPAPYVSHLTASKDGNHVIAITSDDKCVRVFMLHDDGKLHELSQRCMPKRPCALALTPDERTILVGDKFGDVYALPLHPGAKPFKKPSQSAPIPFKPSATALTVHTKGNLNALRQQQLQKLSAKIKTGPDFEHQLIIGHVSLLTDLLAVNLPFTDSDDRGYILTSDRDEHIRVSRGIPQSHVIETYCLNHRDFVSKLCVLPWQPDFLVAGSGEPALKCYSWPTGKILYNAFGTGDELEVLLEARPWLKSQTPLDTRTLKVAVSGIWTMQFFAAKYEASDHGQGSGFVIVSMEGISALFVYLKTFNKPLCHHSTIRLPANALDVATIPDQRSIIVSLDTVHAPNSVRFGRSDSQGQPPSFMALTYSSQPAKRHVEGHGDFDFPPPIIRWHDSPHLIVGINQTVEKSDACRSHVDVSKWEKFDPLSDSDGRAVEKGKMYSPLGEHLYGLENLRKRSIEDQKKIEQEEGEDDEEAQQAIAAHAQPAS